MQPKAPQQPPAVTQDWQAERYATHAGFVAELGMPVVDLLAPHPGERILDLGCGDGVLTARLAALGCAVVGVDGGPDMVPQRSCPGGRRAGHGRPRVDLRA